MHYYACVINSVAKSTQYSIYAPQGGKIHQMIERVILRMRGVDYGQPANFFLLTGVLFGLLIIFITPPVAGLDEEQHFYRSYQVSDFNIRADRVVAPNVYGRTGEGYGGQLPLSVFRDINKVRNSMNENKSFRYSQIKHTLGSKLNQNKKIATRFDNTAIYSPVPYLPQAFGMNVGKLFNTSPVILSYLGRIMALVVWLCLFYFAITISPIAKWAFVVFALNPASIFLGSNLSADAMSISSVGFLVALILYLRGKSTQINIAQYLLLLCTVIVVALQKNVYIPTLLLLFIIPKSVISNRQKTIALAVGLAAGLLWDISILPVASGIPDYFSIDAHISSRDQILFIKEHPLNFIKILVWNIFGMPGVILNQDFAGLVSDTKLPFWVTLAWFTAAYVSLQIKDKVTQVNTILNRNNVRKMFAVTTLIVALAIILSLYIGWNPVGSKEIIGVQARYFIPLSFLVIPLLVHKIPTLNLTETQKVKYVKYVTIVVLVATTITMLVGYIYGIR